WPLLPVESPAGAGMLAAMRAAGWQHATVADFARPVLDRRESYEAFLSGHPHRSRLKDLRRRARRLAEGGVLGFETAAGGPRLTALVEAFLDLERAGWKGEAGSAMACRPQTVALARALFAETDGPVGARADALTLDGRPVAISLALTGNGTATLLKTAFDEGLRTHAPGLLLEAEIVRACHETAFADRLDSATLAGSVLEGLYRERETIAEVVALPPGAGALSLDRRIRLAHFEHRARETARRALKRR
ncbi:GNAT family N-acetyltransferase, partial [Methylobacterium trifolii]